MLSKPQFVGEKVKLGELCDVCSGGTPKRSVSEYWNEGSIPWVKIGDISSKFISSTEEQITKAGLKSSSAKLLAPGTLLYSIFASIGAVGILEIPAATNQAIAGLHIKTDRIEQDYLYHFLKSQEALAKSSGRGVAQNNINLTILREMEVPVPAIGKQKAIVEQLEVIAAQIEQVKTQLDQLASLAKSRFVEMFGDPIKNPFDWRTNLLSNLGNLKNGVNFKSVDSGTEIRCLSVSDFKDCYQISNMELISSVSLNNKPNKTQLLRDGDVVFVRSNGNKRLVGRCLAIFPGDEDVTFSGFCIRFRNESNELLLDYLLGCLKSDSMRKAMTGRGANIQNLSQKILSEVVLPIPPLTLQQEFATFVQHVDKSRFISISRYRDILIKRMNTDTRTYKALIDRDSPN